MKTIRTLALVAVIAILSGCSKKAPAPPYFVDLLVKKELTIQVMPRVGGDYLGGMQYEKEMLAGHPAGQVGGIFYRTFKPARGKRPEDTLSAMCRSGKFSEIVVHLAPFDNSHRYPVSKLLPQVLRDAEVLQRIFAQCPGTRLMLSPFCEHNHPAAVMRLVFQDLRKAAPTALLVNSIWKGQEVPETITEVHLVDSKHLPPIPKNEYTVSADGFGGDGSGDLPDADIPKLLGRYSTARHFRWWNFRNNCKFGHKDTTPIDQRKSCPSVEYIRGHAAMMKQREGAVTWTKGLYKPFADDHGTGGKDNKAMAIMPPFGGATPNSVDVLDSKGKVIDTMSRFMPDHTGEPKGPRYYSKNYAYQIGNLAAKGTGSRLIRIRSGRNVMPATDADLRSHRFR
jgi:hypothetical protein